MEDLEEPREYSNGEVVVVWKRWLCVHSAVCVRGLPEVFRPRERPWVRVEEASSEEIALQCDQCPSGALSSYWLGERQ